MMMWCLEEAVFRSEYISCLHNLGYDVDDNNMTAPENISTLPGVVVNTTV